jgi:hypothetical protein
LQVTVRLSRRNESVALLFREEILSLQGDKIMVNKVAALCIFLFASIAQASTITIDFESAILGSTEVLDQGFRISGDSFGDEFRLGVMDDAGDQFFEAFSHVYEPNCACAASSASVTLERADGGAFAYYSADWTGYQEHVSIEGLLANGSYAIDSVGTGDWLNIISVTYSADGPFCTSMCYFDLAGIEVDNIVVGAAVPIPAAVWLFGSALAGLGWIRRRKTA